MKKKIGLYDIIIAALIIITAASTFMFVRSYVIGKQEQTEFEDLAELVVEVKPESDTVGDTENPSETQTETTRDISSVLKSNSDCVGWIYLNNTVINYPVMHTPDEPEKYLHLSFYKNQSRAGTPFLDEACNVNSSMNLIIYGHNMKNGTMFHHLKRYKNKTYTLDNPIIEFQTKDTLHKYRIFAVCEINDNDSWYSFTKDIGEEAYNAKIQRIKSVDFFETGITPTYPQKLITLSTCKDASGKGRLVVLGVEQ